MFPVNKSSELFSPKELILGVEVDGKFKAYPYSALQNGEGKITDEFNQATFTIQFDKKNQVATILDNRISAVTMYWFAWYAFHPNTKIYSN